MKEYSIGKDILNQIKQSELTFDDEMFVDNGDIIEDNNIPTLLKQTREELGYTKDDIVKNTDLTMYAVIGIERGNKNFSQKTINKYAQFLGIDTELVQNYSSEEFDIDEVIIETKKYIEKLKDNRESTGMFSLREIEFLIKVIENG